MDLTEFSKNEKFELLPEYEKRYFREHGTFKNKANVKKILSKHFNHVRMSGRGKGLQISIGKPKIIGKDELDTALTRLVIAKYRTGIALSFSRWLTELGIDGRGAFELDKQIDELDGVRKALLIEFGNKLHAKQRDYFNRAFKKAAKRIDGKVEEIKMGSRIVGDNRTVSDVLKFYEVAEIEEVMTELAADGIKSPIHARKQDEYKNVLKRLKLERVWTAYTITGVDLFKLTDLQNGTNFPTTDQVRTLFKREFRKWLRLNVTKAQDALKDKPLSDELDELVDLGIMTRPQIQHELDRGKWYVHCLIEGTAWTEYKRLEPYLMGEKSYTDIKPPLKYDNNFKVEPEDTGEVTVTTGELPI